MELDVGTGQPVRGAIGSMEPSHLWILGLAADDSQVARPRPQGRSYSYLTECECPEDCLRDHENE